MKPDDWVSVERIIDAPSDHIYAAWTDPELMAEWMGAQVEADVRVGGGYRIEAPGPDGELFVHSGEYRVLEEGKRIVQTFRAGAADELPEGLPYHDEFIEVRLVPLGPAQTLVRLIDGWLGEEMDDEPKEAVKTAWRGWLDQLATIF
jgi:uncharacterized protein YndB with AHSA1/START domain